MATPPKQGDEQTEDEAQGSTPQLDRLEKLANTAATAAQAKQRRAPEWLAGAGGALGSAKPHSKCGSQGSSRSSIAADGTSEAEEASGSVLTPTALQPDLESWRTLNGSSCRRGLFSQAVL